MYIELIDLLRCPREHEETWLVAAFTKMEGRFIIEGRLGCHVCSASYPVEGGVADLRGPESSREADLLSGGGAGAGHDAEAAMRLAAMLGLTRPRSLVALTGSETMLAAEISELTDCRVIAVNPPALIEDSERVATVLSVRRIPVASASLDGLVLSTGHAGQHDAARVLKAGGRLVTQAGANLPENFRELARDEHYIVAESVGPLVRLSR